MQVCLSIAGSDSCAGAGIQADLKTFAAHSVYGVTAVTAVTVQNTVGVREVQEVSPQIVRDQILCLMEDMPLHAIKIGMVFNAPIIRAIAEALNQEGLPPVVLDPVMVSKSGHELLQGEARSALLEHLFPIVDVVTPNLLEARLLTGISAASIRDMERAAQELRRMGPGAAVVTGGHLDPDPATDVYCDEQGTRLLSGEFVSTGNTHGTGCTFSSAIAANLARGNRLEQAVRQAKSYLEKALAASQPLGRGHGPVAHFF